MKISLFAVIAAVAAVAVASPVPVSPQSVDYPSLKPANVPALFPEVRIAKSDVTGMDLHKRGDTFGHLNRYWGKWIGAKVAADVIADYFQSQFSSRWDGRHQLLNGYWQWYTTVTMANGRTIEVGAYIKDGYVMSANEVAAYVHRALLGGLNTLQGLDWGIFNTGDGGKIEWGHVSFNEL
ncbi:hypothetical protein BGZ52_008142 [Haplosporangium bisporale]|nr:hypothetical protein BGZ52_008142 [Haplosporangium bisporale]KAI9239125.1 MAG: hypothetical protein BYD32DRAFT_411929 [Podila humilis]KAI9239126.1 MAG: hypothetical protein BYD32DRAFT_411930 [Podila humilis]KFH72584.1 hypothetical protein MVEG_02873 [Podila verticillata NRRL 6337]KFH72585.1 hypothetical protein MVEG_02874 [Podila verticillata NRRL 6337]